jgi:hypothetical protein
MKRIRKKEFETYIIIDAIKDKKMLKELIKIIPKINK